MKLIFNAENRAHKDIEERIISMSLAHEVEKVADLEIPILIDGREEIKGLKAIDLHLDQLKDELHNWYYGSC